MSSLETCLNSHTLQLESCRVSFPILDYVGGHRSINLVKGRNDVLHEKIRKWSWLDNLISVTLLANSSSILDVIIQRKLWLLLRQNPPNISIKIRKMYKQKDLCKSDKILFN